MGVTTVAVLAAVAMVVLLLGAGLGVALLALGTRERFTPEEGVPALPELEDVRVVKAREVLTTLASSEHVPLRAASGYLRRQLGSAAKQRAKLGAPTHGDSSLGEGNDSPEEEKLRQVLFAVASLSGLADTPVGEDLSLRVDAIMAELRGESSSAEAFQARSGRPVGSTASGIW